MSDFFALAGAGAALAPNPLAKLAPIMQARGVSAPPAGFQSAVKIAFFDAGAALYDRLSRNLWESLPEQFQRLASDYLRQHPPVSTRMSALDIGCGTGLSAELVLRSRLGAFIRQIDLLDPSQEMLDACVARESVRQIRHRPIRGAVQDLPAGSRYDLVIAGCVLQHIPDLPEFLRQVALRQPPGGVFLHVQDPNADYANDPERLARAARLARRLRVRPATILKRLSAGRPWNGRNTRADVFRRVNDALLARKIMAAPMTEAEIRAVVDLPAHDGRGISIREMQTLLPEHELVSCRSYAFFGELASDLPPSYRRLEQALIAGRAPNGSQVGAIWMKTPGSKS